MFSDSDHVNLSFPSLLRPSGSLVAFLVFGLVGGCLAPATAIAEPPDPEMNIRIHIDGGMLTGQVGVIPMQDALTAIADATRARLVVRGMVGETRPHRFDAVGVAEGIAELAEPNSTMFAYSGDEGGEAGFPDTIIVIGSASGSPAAQLIVTGDKRTLAWDYLEDDALPPVEARLATIGERVRREGQAALGWLQTVFNRDPDARVRHDALEAAAAYDGDEAWAIVNGGIEDGDPTIRLAALYRVVSGSDDVPVPFLVELLRVDGDPGVRAAAATFLGKVRHPEARAALAEARKDPDPEVRQQAESALGGKS